MDLTFTRASLILFLADESILENVGRDIFIFLAAFSCCSLSRSVSLIASNSSNVSDTPFNVLRGAHIGLKHFSPGLHFIHLVFFGLMPSL